MHKHSTTRAFKPDARAEMHPTVVRRKLDYLNSVLLETYCISQESHALCVRVYVCVCECACVRACVCVCSIYICVRAICDVSDIDIVDR